MKTIQICWRVTCLIVLAALLSMCAAPEKQEFPDVGIFSEPPSEFRAIAGMDMQLDRIDEQKAREQIRHFNDLGFGGVFIAAGSGNKGDLPEWYVEQGGSFMHLVDSGIVYLDDEFIRVYRAYLDEADKLGMQVILYDDYNFPTGQVAGQFFQKFPEHMGARLDKIETDHQGPGTMKLKMPQGTYLGATLWDKETNELREVSDRFENGVVSCEVPGGNWKLMAFYLNHQAVLNLRNPGIMNYIEKEAVEKFLTISYDKFYQGFGEYFGTVIPMSFYDEPSLHWLDGRTWSTTLNDLYEEKYGESPLKNYPALWYDIGPGTAAARNAILGIRAEMYANHFVKQLADWCDAHGIQLGGHMDQEEIPNPVMSNGDLMKVFEYQHVPGTDDVFYWGRMNPGYKIVTSASYNYDKPITWAETYAAYQECNLEIAYKTAMDQYAMGINMQNPFPGRLEETMSLDELRDFNNYIGRLSYLLQGGRHVSDVAVLYPIASAQAYNVFGEGWEYGYTGGKMPPEFDYQEVGETLFRRMRMDFTYLHPEVLEKRCVVEKNHLVLNNSVNREEYKVILIPGGNTLHSSTAKKILEFYQNGGKVIATSKLAEFSAEFGMDEVVRSAMTEIFGKGENHNDAGGKAFFLSNPDWDQLKQAMDECLPVRDVEFAEEEWDTGRLSTYQPGLKLDSKEWMEMQRPGYGGALTYTHKVKEGKDIYFFANSSAKVLGTSVRLRGKKSISYWNPNTGEHQQMEVKNVSIDGVNCTEVELKLAPAKSIFFLSE
jgi:hypothetical protein